jgi:hypothetical protein
MDEPVTPGRPSPLGRLWRSPLLVSVVVFLASLAAALRAGLLGTDDRLFYALDDAYIHMAVARNLAEHGVWGVTAFQFSSSSSSLLWTFGLGVAYAVLGVREWVPLALNVAFSLGTLAVAEVAMRRFGAPPLLRGATLLGLVVAFPMTGMVLMGMEHPLHLLLTIAFAAAAVEALARPAGTAREERRRTAALCLLAALLAASRYEGFFLVGLVGLLLLLRRQVARAVAIGVAAVAPVVAFGALSVANGWYVLPNPLMVKAVGEGASTLSKIFKPFGSEDLAFLQNNRAMPILLALGVLAAAAHRRARREPWRPQVLVPALLAGMILLHGHFVFSPMYWAYRYDAYLAGFGLFAAGVATAGWPTRDGLPRGAIAALFVALLVPAVSDVREGLFPEAETQGMRGFYGEQYQTAQLLLRYYPDATVVVNDLGAPTYFTRARILDLVGLGSVEPVRIMRRGPYTSRDVVEWTTPFRPKIAVASLGWSVVVPLIPEEWVRVAVVEMPPHWNRVAFFAVDREECWTLRTAVAQHYAPLAATMGHRMRLRRPEDLREACAPPGTAGSE